MIDNMNVDSKVRSYILQLLEGSKIKGGDKLLGARAIATKVGVSFLKVQQAIDGLVRDGILKTISRKGTFVQENWRERILQTNLSLYNASFPWVRHLSEILERRLPSLRLVSEFSGGVFELTTTLKAQVNRREYMDLSDIFHRLYSDKSIFYERPFATCRAADGLWGIPFIFSPRVIFFNHKLFEKAGCDAPRAGWTWEEFIVCIRKLKKVLPCDKVFDWNTNAHFWINFIFRAGGGLIDLMCDDPVKIDHPRTQYAIRLLSDLRDELGMEDRNFEFQQDFLAGDAAFLVAPREFMIFIAESGFEDWRTAPLPLIKGGVDVNVQATDLLCVRKNCVDYDLAEAFIETMLSEEVQDLIAKSRYGIPIRKSSAFKSVDIEDPRDSLFMAEASKMTAEYNIDSPELLTLIQDGIAQIWKERQDVEKATFELASGVRTFLKIKKKAQLYS